MMRRIVVAVLNTVALCLVGLAVAAALAGAWLTWGAVGVAWAAVPCAVIAAALAVWLAMLAEGEDTRHAKPVQRDTGPVRRRP